MGRGDIKTKRGKIAKGTYGVLRPHKKKKVEVTTAKSKAKKAAPKKDTAKKPAAKKAVPKKAAAKKKEE